jgi:phospholipid/cholesterol/gamma-HCH transport system substrate-binding protein
LQTEGSVYQTLFSDTLAGNKAQKIIGDIEMSSKNLITTTDQLKSFLATIENSKGALNYVVNDSLLPKEIESTVREIKESSEKLNENMEALKHNFLFRGYFKKQEREARKEAKKSATQNPIKDEN